GVVAERGGLPLPVREAREIARRVVGEALAVAEGIGTRGEPVHRVVGIRGRIALRVGDGQEVAVAVVGEAGGTAQRIEDRRASVQGIVCERRRLAARIGLPRQTRSWIVMAGRGVPGGGCAGGGNAV